MHNLILFLKVLNIYSFGDIMKKVLTTTVILMLIISTIGISVQAVSTGIEKLSDLYKQKGYMFVTTETIIEYYNMQKTSDLIAELSKFRGIAITFSSQEHAFDNQTRDVISKFIEEYKTKTGGVVFSRIYYQEYTMQNKTYVVYMEPFKDADGIIILDPATLLNFDKYKEHIKNKKVLVFVTIQPQNNTYRLVPDENTVLQHADTIIFNGMDIHYSKIYNRKLYNATIDFIKKFKNQNKEIMILTVPIFTPQMDQIYIDDTIQEFKEVSQLVHSGLADSILFYSYSIIPYPIAKYFIEPDKYTVNFEPINNNTKIIYPIIVGVIVGVVFAFIYTYKRNRQVRKEQENNKTTATEVLNKEDEKISDSENEHTDKE